MPPVDAVGFDDGLDVAGGGDGDPESRATAWPSQCRLKTGHDPSQNALTGFSTRVYAASARSALPDVHAVKFVTTMK
jgi:hypothetical protein